MSSYSVRSWSMKQALPNPMHVMDVAAITIIVGAWAQILPGIAAAFAALWYMVQIWESKTVRKWTNRLETPEVIAHRVVETAKELAHATKDAARALEDAEKGDDHVHEIHRRQDRRDS